MTLQEGRLHMQITGQPKIRLYLEGGNRYFAREAEIQVEFGANGLVLRGAGGSVTAEKIP